MATTTMLDAGFANQLQKYVKEKIDGHPLWVARFVVSDKENCLKVYRDFVRAGTEIMRASTYQITIDGFKKHLGYSEAQTFATMEESVKLAKQAVLLENEKSGKNRKVLIAGSVGPYGAHLNDGSEYTGAYFNQVTREGLKEWHRKKIQVLVDAGVDLLAFETVPCSVEAFALIDILKELPSTKAWLSFSIKDSKRISNGEIFSEVASKCWEMAPNQLVAVGANCFSPSLVIPLFKTLYDVNPSIPLIVYPNSGETYDTENGRWVETKGAKKITDYTDEWLRFGFRYIGGCCRTTDIELQQISKQIKNYSLAT